MLLTASCSYVNAGIPIVAIQLPFILALLVPIILIEAILLRESFSLHWFTAPLISFKANEKGGTQRLKNNLEKSPYAPYPKKRP